jgi:hypothetical protein
VTVGVKAWLDSQGHTRVDFSMHLRFVPSSNPAQWVNLTFADLEASLDPMFNIYYCASVTTSCVDEATTDPTLVTVRNPITAKLTRRIKHFSGYNIAAARIQPKKTASTSTETSAGLAIASFPINGLHINTQPWLFRRPELEILLSRVVFLHRFSGYMLASG